MLVRDDGFSVTLPSDREIAITRILDAPPSLVFDVWTRPEHIPHWWGCSGSTLTVCEIDLRVGGAWRFVLRMADGTDHPFRGIYREIVRPDRLVYTECYDAPSIGSPEWLTTVTFEERNGRTFVKSTLLHASKQQRDGHLQAGMEPGMAHTMQRLSDLVASIAEAQGAAAVRD